MSTLPPPYYRDDRSGITIFHGDAHDVVPFLTPDSVELLVTDPPWGVGFDYGPNGHDDDPDGYIQWLWPIIETAEIRCIREEGFCAVFQSAKHARSWPSWFPRPWRLLALPKSFVQIHAIYMQWATDYALVWPRGNEAIGQEGCRKLRQWQVTPSRDWFVSQNNNFRSPIAHPCSRPLDTMRYIIGLLCPPGGTVLDPFMGSGTTLLAEKMLGRHAVGIEINEGFCELAVRRLQQEFLPLDFSADSVVQGSLAEGWGE